MTAALTLEQLEQHPDYRVLRRFRPRESYGSITSPKIGLYVDVESTGLNTDEDRVIQFAAVRFAFDSAGNVGQIGPTFCGLEDPGVPLSPEVMAVTRLTDEQLKGQKIDDAKVAEILDGVVLVIAHNADFDRKMVEKRFTGFDTIAWGCSQRDVPWDALNVRGMKLDYLLMEACREFYQAHDALADCLAGLHVLGHPRFLSLHAEAPLTETPFQMLLRSVREPTFRVWARSSPIETKDRLRLRRYRWDDRRCWHKDVKAADVDAEKAWLTDHVYDGDFDWAGIILVTKVSRFDLYSRRA